MVQRHGTEQRPGSWQARSIGGTIWHTTVGWVREEPVAASALVLAFIALGIAFEWWHWSPAQTGAVVGIVAALLGMFVRSQVTPIYRLRPKAGPPGASGRGVSSGSQDELDSGVRVLPGAGPGAGPVTRPDLGPPGPQPARPDVAPPGGKPTRPDLGPLGGPNSPPGFPGPGLLP
jgi:hypothetical protein